MRNVKRIGVLLLVIGALFVGGGFAISVLFQDNIVNKNEQNKKEEPSEDYEVLPDGTKVYNGYPTELLEDIVVNDSIELKKKHCLDSYCITSMKVSYQEGVFGSIETEIQNISDNVLSAGFLNMEFETPSGVVVKFMYHLEMLPGEKTRVRTNFLEKDIAYASNYQLTYPTDEQLVEYQKTLVS